MINLGADATVAVNDSVKLASNGGGITQKAVGGSSSSLPRAKGEAIVVQPVVTVSILLSTNQPRIVHFSLSRC